MSKKSKNNKSVKTIKPVNFSFSGAPLVKGIPKAPEMVLRPPVAKFNVDHMANTAFGFYKTAKVQGKNIFRRSNSGLQLESASKSRLSEIVGTHFAVGVNLAFAMELYLKAILNCTGNYKSGHSLLGFYDSISIFHRGVLDAIYKSMKPPEGKAFAFALSPSADVAPIFLGNKAEVLRNVLEYADNIFVKWRYAYEELDRDFVLEYSTMRRVCMAMRKFLRVYKSQARRNLQINSIKYDL